MHSGFAVEHLQLPHSILLCSPRLKTINSLAYFVVKDLNTGSFSAPKARVMHNIQCGTRRGLPQMQQLLQWLGYTTP
jgi:hypothetical protein